MCCICMQAVLGCTTALGQELQQAAAAAVLTARQRTVLMALRCHRETRLEVEETHLRCLEAMPRLLHQTPAQPPQMHQQLLRMHPRLRQILQLALR